ncbi:UNVERIFIED_CONTAM: Haloacid dehalogenase-like hydrolase domain-containing protein [Sesamum indicum]
MASFVMLRFPPHLSNSLAFSSRPPLFSLFKTRSNTFSAANSRTTSCRPLVVTVSASSGALQALIFDCDGVILESEHLHRQAYNDAFAHFNVRCPSSSSSQPLNWSLEFYDELQNLIGGGKPKMRWYFKEHGWPTSTVLGTSPESDEDRAKLIDILQDWKTERYKEIIKSGTVEPRPGVLRLMDEAKASGKLLAVCSAATKSSVILCLENLIGMDFSDAIAIYPDLSNVRHCLKMPLLQAKTFGTSCRIHRDDIANWIKPDPIVCGTEYLRITAV